MKKYKLSDKAIELVMANTFPEKSDDLPQFSEKAKKISALIRKGFGSFNEHPSNKIKVLVELIIGELIPGEEPKMRPKAFSLSSICEQNCVVLAVSDSYVTGIYLDTEKIAECVKSGVYAMPDAYWQHEKGLPIEREELLVKLQNLFFVTRDLNRMFGIDSQFSTSLTASVLAGMFISEEVEHSA